MSLFAEDEFQDASAENAVAPEDEHLSDPQTMTLCLGHSEQEQHFLNLHKKNQIPHGLIFTGLKGVGKATFAHRLTRFLLVNDTGQDQGDSLFGDALPAVQPENMDTSPEDQAVRLYNGNAHPDCKVITRPYDESKGKYKDAVDVAEIRKIAPFLRMSSSDGGWRIVVIDDADTMNRNAQNALLKVLEEPPSKTLIILIAHRPGKLIPTIHSRTQRVQFHALEEDTLRDILAKAEDRPTGNDLDKLINLSKGSAGAAIQMWEEGGLESLHTAISLIESYPKIDWPLVHKLSDGLSRAGNDESYRQVLSMLQHILQSCVLAKSRNNLLPNYLPPSIQTFADKQELTRLIQRSDDLGVHIGKSLGANLDKKQTLLHAIDLIMA